MKKNIPDVVHALQKIKDEVEFNLSIKKKINDFRCIFCKRVELRK